MAFNTPYNIRCLKITQNYKQITFFMSVQILFLRNDVGHFEYNNGFLNHVMLFQIYAQHSKIITW